MVGNWPLFLSVLTSICHASSPLSKVYSKLPFLLFYLKCNNIQIKVFGIRMWSSIRVQNHCTPDARSLSTGLFKHFVFSKPECFVQSSGLGEVVDAVWYQFKYGVLTVILLVVEFIVKRSLLGECLQRHVGSIAGNVKLLNKVFKCCYQFWYVYFFNTFCRINQQTKIQFTPGFL